MSPGPYNWWRVPPCETCFLLAPAMVCSLNCYSLTWLWIKIRWQLVASKSPLKVAFSKDPGIVFFERGSITRMNCVFSNNIPPWSITIWRRIASIPFFSHHRAQQKKQTNVCTRPMLPEPILPTILRNSRAFSCYIYHDFCFRGCLFGVPRVCFRTRTGS